MNSKLYVLMIADNYFQVAPPASQGAAAIAAATAASQNRARSLSVAADTPEGHWEVVHQQNPQFYR